MYKIFHTLFISLALFILCSANYVLAASPVVSPPIIDLEVAARDIISETITLKNPTGSLMRVYPSVHNIAIDEGGVIEVFEHAVDVDRTNTVTSWIEISRSRIEIAPGDTKEIPVTFRLHPEVEPGEYHALIGFSVASNKIQAQEKVLSGQSPSAIVRLAVGQNKTTKLSLEQFVVDRFVIDTKNGEALYAIKNTGELDVVPEGEIVFYDTRGIEVGAVSLDGAVDLLKPNQEKLYTAAVPEDLRLGKYKAFLTLQYGTDNTASLTDTSFFYVMPWLPMLIIFGSILLFCILVVIYVYRRLSVAPYDDEPQDVAFYRSQEASPETEHDINLSQKQ